ncbi:MAG: hypothetical protein K0Q53_2894 [Massilibacillus sp.]|jgi:cell division protein FtsA|nr:hypothetical protein [Massilibacillus sp.]
MKMLRFKFFYAIICKYIWSNEKEFQMTAQITEAQYRQRVFAVDIGTRSVIGLVGYYEDGKLVVEHGEVQYHKNRVMIDGQIHEIDSVAESIKEIKANLEQASGQTFTEVAIAAAGRSLVTTRFKLEQEIDSLIPIEKNLIDRIETECLQNIYSKMIEESQEMKDYFCIGHSVVYYYLDGKMMLSLQGHKGSRIGVDLVATFLPRTVVDSLYTAVSRIGLDVSYLTLEPIAAIEVAIPSNIRMLNIALVDIGAGTSDIAITKDGTVIAYAMTSTAGDEITEALAKAYLLDFDSAELLKCTLSEQPMQKFKDIFGIEHEIPTEEILNQLTDVIDLIAKNIADNVIEKNGNAPSAVFLTGGGSKIPRLNQFISKYFDLPIERVSTRDMTNIPNLHVKNFSLTGPEVITPIGILAKAISHYGRDFVEVYVNGANVRLFNTKTLMVVDALILVGFNPHDLIAKAAKSYVVQVNGQMKKLFGEAEEHGEIYVNDKPASISTPIKAKDQIVMVPAKNGKEPDLTISHVIPVQTNFMLNGLHERAITNIRVNGEFAESGVRLNDQDIIKFDQIITVEDLLKQFAIQTPFNVNVNGLDVDDGYVIADQDFIEIPAWNSKQPDAVEVMSEFEMNVDGSHNIVDYDFVEISAQKDDLFNSVGIITESVVEEIGYDEAQEIKVDKVFAAEESLFLIDEDTFIEILYNGTSLRIPGEKPLVFVNLFDYIDFDRTQPKGTLHMTHNGNSVNYFDPIQDSDVIEIKWI